MSAADEQREFELRERLAQLDRLIAEYPYWGAALTRYKEERDAVKFNLLLLERADSE